MNKRRKFLFLINPIAGTRSKQAIPDSILRAANHYAHPVEILPTLASGNYTFIKEKIIEEHITDVVVCGGDGTVNSVVQQLSGTNVNFGIVPMGSGNGLALTAKIPRALSKALAIVFEGKPVLTDAFSINQNFACVLCGLGFDAQVAHDFALQSKRGLATYVRQSLKHFMAAKPYSFKITLPETSFNTDAFFISIANSNQFGNKFTIAPRASLSDGLLDIVVVPKMAKARLPFSILSQVAGGNVLLEKDNLNKKGILYFQTDQLTIKNIDNAPFHIDGEPQETIRLLNIKIIPKFFKLLQRV
jgi:diacylglycerol kinase (ATP)